MNDLIFKGRECSPQETCDKIFQILLNNGKVFDINHNVILHEFDLYSCQIKDLQLNRAVNGKGSTPAYALASGLGEYIERLASNFLSPRSYSTPLFPDEEVINDILYTPCRNLYTEEVELIKTKSLYENTTGVASGNSYYEAMFHALCEVLERYAFLLLSKGELRINRDITSEYIAKYIPICDYLESTCKIYDISLFEVPIVLVFLQKTNDPNLCACRIDVSYSFDLAIERCFLEFTQNFSETKQDAFCPLLDVEFSVKENYINFVKLPNGCFSKPLFKKLFTQEFTNYNYSLSNNLTNEEYCNLFLEKSKDIFSSKLYVREFNFYGLPVVKVFCEELNGLANLTEICNLSNKLLTIFATTKDPKLKRQIYSKYSKILYLLK